MNPPLRSAIILGAGRPARGQLPAALVTLGKKQRVLDWQISVLTKTRADITFVGGYQLPDIVASYPDLHCVLNPKWAETGPTASLLCAKPPLNRDCLVGYADILYHSELVDCLCVDPAEVVIAVDSHWRQRYDRRSTADLGTAEIVQLEKNRLRIAYGRLSTDRPEIADAEFIGLMRIGPRALHVLHAFGTTANSWDIPRLLNEFVASGILVETLDCAGRWAELNAPQDVARFLLGTKAQTLGRLKTALRHSQIGESVAFTVGDWNASHPNCIKNIRRAFAQDILAVRSSTLREDGFSASEAGHFKSILNVNSQDDILLSGAIEQVIASYGDSNPLHQVLIQRMITDTSVSGVVMTRTLSYGAPYLVINYDTISGKSDSVTSGSGSDLQTVIIHHEYNLLPDTAPPELNYLLRAIKEIVSLMGHDSLDIEFIISLDQTVHILQVRPIAVNHAHWRGTDEAVKIALEKARFDFKMGQIPGPLTLGERAPFSVMTDWNPAEMIGSRPRRLAYSIYNYLLTRDVWAIQRQQYGYRCLQPQPLMRCFAGYPYIDVRASLNSFIPAEINEVLAEKLVQYGLEHLIKNPHLHDKIEFEIAFTCLSFDFDERAKALRSAGFESVEIDRLRESLRKLTHRGMKRVDGDLEILGEFEKEFSSPGSRELTPLRTAIVLLEYCRKKGALVFAHLARAGFIATALLKSAVETKVISENEKFAYLQSIPTIATDCRNDLARLGEGDLGIDAFLQRYGFLRPGTYDITVPTYADRPDFYLSKLPGALASSAPCASTVWPHTTQQRFSESMYSLGLGSDFKEVDRFMRNAIAGREKSKFALTRVLSLALDLIANAGSEIGLTREQISHLSLNDLRDFNDGLLFDNPISDIHERAKKGELAHEISLGIELPPLLLNEHDIGAFFYSDAMPNFVGNSAVIAPLVCIDSLEYCGNLEGHIVMVSKADPGFDWLFGHNIAGLVTAYGGANSHMTVRAAEFGLPAAIGVGEKRYHELARGSTIHLNCGQRTITLLQ